jgi:hypothetical protein
MIRDFCVITGSDGALATAAGSDLSTPEEVGALVHRLSGAKKVVLHIHGGLVSASQALSDADKLRAVYTDAGIHPVFVIWKTGPLETLDNLLQNLFSEYLFSILVRRVSGFVARKLTGDILGEFLSRSPSEALPVPDDFYATLEFQKRKKDVEPLKELALAKPSEVTHAEQLQFEQELSEDGELLEAAEKAARWLEDQEQGLVDPTFAARGVEGESKQTMIDKELLLGPRTVGTLRARGFFSAAKLIKTVAVVGYKVVHRIIQKRDHGPYATIVEELLRECYVAEFGEKVWGTMKRQARETFQQAADPRGGRLLMEQLAQVWKKPHSPKLSVVAHSAGGIYTCHMVEYIATERGRSLPDNLSFADVIFLAPACSFTLFQNAWNAAPDLFSNFRMFALSDLLESGYWEVKVIYPRSLLYLVAGALELEDDGATGAYDLPILGMQRYFDDTEVYNMPRIATVRQSLAGKVIWSVHDGGDGLRVDSQKHGQFFFGPDQHTSQVMQSVVHVLKQGL